MAADIQYDNNNTGAFWAKKAVSGLTYYSGYVIIDGTKHYLSLFKNSKKTEAKHPDLNLIVNEQVAETTSTDDLPF